MQKHEDASAQEALTALLSRAYWGDISSSLYPNGPTRELIEAEDPAANPWFIEPALRATYLDAAQRSTLPAPVDGDTAKLIGYAACGSTTNNWPEFVLTNESTEPLGTDAYRQHVALLLHAWGRDVSELRAARGARTQLTYTQLTDPLYRSN